MERLSRRARPISNSLPKNCLTVRKPCADTPQEPFEGHRQEGPDMSDDSRSVSALRATAHPVRLRILSLLTASALSAAEIARELDLTHANASYHLRVLADAGAVVEAGEGKIRGGVAKRYRHPWEQQPRGPVGPGARERGSRVQRPLRPRDRRGAGTPVPAAARRHAAVDDRRGAVGGGGRLE